MKKLNLFAVALAVLLLSVSGWGECSWSNCNGSTQCTPTVEGYCPDSCTYDASSAGAGGTCTSTVLRWKPTGQDCFRNGAYYYRFASVQQLLCSSQCEMDSVSCIFDGNIWQDDPSATCGKSCKINYCKAADSTWLSTSIASCIGSNNYAIVNNDSTCEHVGTCCPNDSIPSGNTCKWRCDSVLTTCNDRTGELFGGVLPDTSVSGQDTTFSYQCYYNCSHSPNPDSSVYLVEGNIVLSGPSDSIPDGIKSQSTFNSVRTTTGGVYIYDYLSPAASEYIDSIATVKCVEHLWRCVINNKYVYWYDNQEVPAGCTNIVRVK